MILSFYGFFAEISGYRLSIAQSRLRMAAKKCVSRIVAVLPPLARGYEATQELLPEHMNYLM
jgi:hypothetical protein